MNGNSNHTSSGLVVEREVSTHRKDGGLRSGMPRPSTSTSSRRLTLREELRTGDNGMSRLLTVEDVAALLNVPPRWVYRHAGLKPPAGIPHVKVGKYLRFRESDLREYVERLRTN